MTIQVNGTQLFYQKSGSGPPLLLLHGNGEDHHIFDALTAKLAAHFSVYAVDSRGHGQSAETETFLYDDMMEDIHQLIRALNLQQPSVVGFSDGAIIALLLAIKHPGAVQKMALLGVNLSPADFMPHVYAKLQSAYQRKGGPLLRLMLEHPNISLDEVRQVQTPTLLVAAEHDLFRPETFPALADAMPNAALKIMQGHDHDSYVTNQDILSPDLLAFFCNPPARMPYANVTQPEWQPAPSRVHSGFFSGNKPMPDKLSPAAQAPPRRLAFAALVTKAGCPLRPRPFHAKLHARTLVLPFGIPSLCACPTAGRNSVPRFAQAVRKPGWFLTAGKARVQPTGQALGLISSLRGRAASLPPCRPYASGSQPGQNYNHPSQRVAQKS